MFYFMGMSLLSACTTYVPGAREDQERASDSLELELQIIVNHHVGPEN